MLSDIEIAQSSKIQKITEIAKKIGLSEDELELYGAYKAKITTAAYDRLRGKDDGRLVLVTAISPTPAGEGKTTTTIGLGDAINAAGKNAVIALREPSLGPVFGIKGGAAGGGYAQVLPMEDINLHFTGDIHAIGTANNLLCAAVDNSIYQGNPLNIDPQRVIIRRVMDMNDRALRDIEVGLGAKTNGVPRKDGFMITVACEIMAILCLSCDILDLKERCAHILVGYTYDGKPVFCSDLNLQGSLAALLKDAIKPNLVQTIEGTACLIHGGPFANIAHGCNSVIATKLALKAGDYCITEAGFGSDLGGEKFLDIKCRLAGLKPSAIVLVATVRALKYHGGAEKAALAAEDLPALEAGIPNLAAHLDSLGKFNVPVVVAINKFPSDTAVELEAVGRYLSGRGIPYALSEVHAKGSGGATELARLVVRECEKPLPDLKFLYELKAPVKEKISMIVKSVYGADSVSYEETAERSIAKIEEMGFGSLPICMAKTQYSLSDDPKKLCRPSGYVLNVRDVRLSAGAGFIVVLAGAIMTMPGLPKIPAAMNIDIDRAGVISGLF